jgi:hypothetical protein
VAKIRETNGQEYIRLKDGSTYRIIAPRPKAFRSWSADLIIFDEAREQRDYDLWGAAIPTQRARPNPQVWVASNAGDPDSVVLNGLRDRGRAAAADPESDRTIAYLEWSAAGGIDRPLDDPTAWAEANPSLGGRLTADTVRDELISLSEDSFRTEVLCQWVETRGEAAIPWPAWLACAGTPPAVTPGLPRPTMGVHVSGDRTHAAVALAAWRDDRLITDLVEEWHDPDGVDLLEVARSVSEWMRTFKVRELAYIREAASTIAQRVREPVAMTRTEQIVASSTLTDAVTTGTLWHRSNPSLDEQIAAASKRVRDDGSWMISQALSDRDITGVLALSFAVNLAYRPRRTSSIHTAPER